MHTNIYLHIVWYVYRLCMLHMDAHTQAAKSMHPPPAASCLTSTLSQPGNAHGPVHIAHLGSTRWTQFHHVQPSVNTTTIKIQTCSLPSVCSVPSITDPRPVVSLNTVSVFSTLLHWDLLVENMLGLFLVGSQSGNEVSDNWKGESLIILLMRDIHFGVYNSSLCSVKIHILTWKKWWECIYSSVTYLILTKHFVVKTFTYH